MEYRLTAGFSLSSGGNTDLLPWREKLIDDRVTGSAVVGSLPAADLLLTREQRFPAQQSYGFPHPKGTSVSALRPSNGQHSNCPTNNADSPELLEI